MGCWFRESAVLFLPFSADTQKATSIYRVQSGHFERPKKKNKDGTDVPGQGITEKRNKVKGRWDRNWNDCFQLTILWASVLGRMAWFHNNFGSVVHIALLKLIPQLVMCSFTVVLKVPYTSINVYSAKLADINSQSLNVFKNTFYKLIMYFRLAHFSW